MLSRSVLCAVNERLFQKTNDVGRMLDTGFSRRFVVRPDDRRLGTGRLRTQRRDGRRPAVVDSRKFHKSERPLFSTLFLTRDAIA